MSGKTEDSPNIPRAYELIVVESCDSAWTHAERLAMDGAEEGTLVWAKSQSEGRSRAGGYWMSGYKNLHLAIIFRPEDQFELCGQLCFLAMIATGKAIARQANPMDEIKYYWPNKVMLNQSKVASVSLSAQVADSITEWLVVSLNVNVFGHPESLGWSATSMQAEGSESHNRIRLLEAFSRDFLSLINQWTEDGFEPIRKIWQLRSHEKNDQISITVNRQTIGGSFIEMDKQGSLILNKEKTIKVTVSDYFQSEIRIKTENQKC